MSKRIVITGVGVLASNGIGREDYWQGLEEGRIGYKAISLFDTAEFLVQQGGEITDFQPEKYMGTKGLRSLDRSTKLLVSAARLALEDASFKTTEENTLDVGVSVGSTLGSVKSISDFDEVTLREGPRYTNPALFPNTVINSPASQVSIWHNIKGFNTTISTGFTASLDAINYAYDFIVLDRIKLVLAGGVEEMCRPTFYGFHALKFLSGSQNGNEFINCPFDRRRNGITFGEGACLIVLEDLEHAKNRGAKILAEIAGFGYSFDPFRIHKYNPQGTGLKESIRSALKNARLSCEDIDYICANANSTPMADKIETEAIKDVFGKRAYHIPISAVKSMIGESFSVSGALQVAAALGAINKDFIPPTVNYQEKDPHCDLDYVPGKARKARLNHVMVTNFGPSGNHICVILKRFTE